MSSSRSGGSTPLAESAHPARRVGCEVRLAVPSTPLDDSIHSALGPAGWSPTVAVVQPPLDEGVHSTLGPSDGRPHSGFGGRPRELPYYCRCKGGSDIISGPCQGEAPDEVPSPIFPSFRSFFREFCLRPEGVALRVTGMTPRLDLDPDGEQRPTKYRVNRARDRAWRGVQVFA